jgi:hypothetical protein
VGVRRGIPGPRAVHDDRMSPHVPGNG